MGFEIFIPRKTATRAARINITSGGTFWMNPATTREFFKGFDRTFLFYDKERRVIGLKPTHEDEHTYSVSRSGRRNTAMVSGTAFFKYYEIPHTEVKSYKPTWNDKEKLVEVDLNKPL